MVLEEETNATDPEIIKKIGEKVLNLVDYGVLFWELAQEVAEYSDSLIAVILA